MKITLHYHWPLRDKIVQCTKHIPTITGEELTEAVEAFIDEALKYSKMAGFGMEIKIEEDEGGNS